jgi:ATP-dependent Clp protease ATP-binding subunit ClpA
MDEGKIHDKLGKEGNFSNALILFTSNIGSAAIVEKFEKSQIPSSTELMQTMSTHFRPEFLARITEIIPFAPITESMAERIFHIQLKSLRDALSRMSIKLSLSDEVVKNLALTGFSSKYGARQIGGIIRAQLARPISKMIIREEVKSGQDIVVSWDAVKHKISWEILSVLDEVSCTVSE